MFHNNNIMKHQMRATLKMFALIILVFLLQLFLRLLAKQYLFVFSLETVVFLSVFFVFLLVFFIVLYVKATVEQRKILRSYFLNFCLLSLVLGFLVLSQVVAFGGVSM